MKPNTQLILVSAQPIPNLTPILDESLKPKTVVMLVSNDMQERGLALAKIFKERGIHVEQIAVANPWDADQISDLILDVLSQYPDGDIALNATGGTKLMSIAAYEAFRSVDYPIFYVHPEQDRLLWLQPKQPAVDFNNQLKIKDYLIAYGANQVEIPSTFGVKATIRSLTEHILAGIELGSLNYLAYQADNSKLAVEINHGPLSRPVLWELLDLFEQAGLCRINGHALQFTDAEARFIANGGWLEQHTYGICLNLKKELALQDVAANITINRQPGGKVPVKNEIDIALIKHNRLHLIECKTKRFDDQSADVLYKLDSLRDLMGGLQGRALLVSFNQLDKPSRARAKELNIHLICKTELQNLQQNLSRWLLGDR